MKTINITELSKAIAGAQQCKEGFKESHLAKIDELRELLPHGSGIDGNIYFDMNKSTPEKIVIFFEYHHMNEGYYTNWTEHNVIITPSLQHGFNMKITGRNQDDVKDYFYDLFSETFTK